MFVFDEAHRKVHFPDDRRLVVVPTSRFFEKSVAQLGALPSILASDPARARSMIIPASSLPVVKTTAR